MSAFTPGQSPVTPQQLANSLFQAPAPEPTQLPAYPPAPQPQPIPAITPSGGVAPAVPPQSQPVVAPSGYTPPYYTAAPAPAAPPAPVQPTPKRTEIERLVRQGALTPQEAAYYPSDDVLFDELLSIVGQQAQQAQPQQPAPAAQPQQPAVPAQSYQEIAQTAVALQQQGVLTFENGRYVSKYPEFAAVADRLNTDRLQAEQSLQELRNPREWLQKHGKDFIEEYLKPVQEEVQRVRQALMASLPAPHEKWISANRQKLYTTGPDGQLTDQLSPAGQLYDRVYHTAMSQGVKDPRILHETAAQAAETMFGFAVQPAAPAPAPEPQQSFWSAAASPQQPVNPGFNLPGTALANHQQNRSAIPVTNQGNVDFRALAQGVLNGSIPR